MYTFLRLLNCHGNTYELHDKDLSIHVTVCFEQRSHDDQPWRQYYMDYDHVATHILEYDRIDKSRRPKHD